MSVCLKPILNFLVLAIFKIPFIDNKYELTKRSISDVMIRI